jgi:putative transposase
VPGTEPWPKQPRIPFGRLAALLLLPEPVAVPRPPRDIAPGIRHLGVGAGGSIPYFHDDLDRATWLRLFVATVSRHGWRCLAACLLSTHWHAIVETPDGSLASGMHRLVGGYSRRFNDRHVRVGYLVRDRYWARRKEDAPALLEAFRYVALNPVAAGLADRPEDWRWSSYGTTVGVSEMFAFVDASPILGEFGSSRAAQVRGLRQFVETG